MNDMTPSDQMARETRLLWLAILALLVLAVGATYLFGYAALILLVVGATFAIFGLMVVMMRG